MYERGTFARRLVLNEILTRCSDRQGRVMAAQANAYIRGLQTQIEGGVMTQEQAIAAYELYVAELERQRLERDQANEAARIQAAGWALQGLGAGGGLRLPQSSPLIPPAPPRCSTGLIGGQLITSCP